MDIFEFRATRVVNTEGVFETFKEGDNDLGGLFMRLKNLTIAELHTQWDIVFLDTYIKHLMVPRSLRWELAPHKGDNDLEGWYKYFNDSGLSLLKFLGERKTTKLKRLDEEIKLIKEKLTPFMPSEEYSNRSNNLLRILEKEEKEQKTKKKKKFNGDFGDYENNVVFDWQKKLLAEASGSSIPAMEVTLPYVNMNPVNASVLPSKKNNAVRIKPNNTPRGHYKAKKPLVAHGNNMGRGGGGQRGSLGPPHAYYTQPWRQNTMELPVVPPLRAEGILVFHLPVTLLGMLVVKFHHMTWAARINIMQSSIRM